MQPHAQSSHDQSPHALGMVMKQSCYQLEKDKPLSVVPCADLKALLAVGQNDYWQEIETVTPDELAAWVQPQDLHPLMVGYFYRRGWFD